MCIELEVQSQRKPKGKAARAYAKRHLDPKKCTECGVNPINTVFIPCGHMVLCNVCLLSRKIDLNTNLLLRSEPEFCTRCNDQIKKVRKAFCP